MLENQNLAQQMPQEGNTQGSGFPMSLQGVKLTPPSGNPKPLVAAANYGSMW